MLVDYRWKAIGVQYDMVEEPDSCGCGGDDHDMFVEEHGCDCYCHGE